MTTEQIAKLIELIDRDVTFLNRDIVADELINTLVDVVTRQQQLINYLLERENERQEDGK